MADSFKAGEGERELNVKELKEMLAFQKDITQEIRDRRRILEQAHRLDSSIEASLQEQMAIQSHRNKALAEQHEELQRSLMAMVLIKDNADQTAKIEAKRLVDVTANKIKSLELEVAMSKALFDKHLEKLKEIQSQHDFIKKSIGDRLGLELKELSTYKSVKDEIAKTFPDMRMATAGTLAMIMTVASFGKEVYKSFEEAAASFRKYMGMQRAASQPIKDMAEDMAVNLQHVGVQIKGVYDATQMLGEQMGGVHGVTKELIQTTALLNAQLGVSEDYSAGVMRNLAVASKSTMRAQKDMTYFAAAMSEAGGVPLNLVMGDVAKMSGTAFAMISKTPLAIIKSAVEARKLGTTINDMARASESIIDFQNSVNAEMEASVLLGQSINLQRARHLAYNKDLVGSTKEILRIARDVDFENLDVFQMQAFARATGRSVDELTKMIQAEREMDEIRSSTDPKVQRQLKAYEAMKLANEANAKANGKNLELLITQKANQERITAVTQRWNQFLMEISRVFLPIIDGILRSLLFVFEKIAFVTEWLNNTFGKYTTSILFTVVAATKLFKSFTAIRGVLGTVLGYLSPKKLGGMITDLFKRTTQGAEQVAKSAANVGQDVSKTVAATAENVGKGAKSIFVSVSEAIKEIAGNLSSALKDVFVNISEGVGEALKNISSGVGEAISNIAQGIGKGIEVIFKGLARGLEYMGQPKVFKGIAAVALLGVSLVPFAFAMSLMTNLNWKSLGVAAVAMVAFTAAAFGLGALIAGPGAIIFGAGVIGIAALGVALIPFAFAAKKAAEAMVLLGQGFGKIIGGLERLSNLSFIKTVAQLHNLTNAIKSVSSALSGIPSLKLEKLSNVADMYVPVAQVTPTETKLLVPETQRTQHIAPSVVRQDDASSHTLKEILSAINLLNKNLESGKIRVYVDGQLMSATLACQTAFKGGYGMNVV